MLPTQRARQVVQNYFNERSDSQILGEDDVYVVWYSYVLGNWKALVSTVVDDGMYYEITYDRNKDRTYLDAYKKQENLVVKR